MPCSGDNYSLDEEDKGVDFKKLTRSLADADNAKARKYMDWLERQLAVTIREPIDDVGRLCELISGMGETQFLYIVKREFDDPVARQLAGWWEDHKESDALRDERGE